MLSDGSDLTRAGNAFQTLAATTGKYYMWGDSAVILCTVENA